MRPAIRWALMYLALAIALVTLGTTIINQVESEPTWDGTFQCRPGETYTTAECP